MALSAGLGKQRKWSVSLPEAATRAAILTLESAPASRQELEEVLRWKTERAFGAPPEELIVTRERLHADAQGRQRYLAVGIRAVVLAAITLAAPEPDGCKVLPKSDCVKVVTLSLIPCATISS